MAHVTVYFYDKCIRRTKQLAILLTIKQFQLLLLPMLFFFFFLVFIFISIVHRVTYRYCFFPPLSIRFLPMLYLISPIHFFLAPRIVFFLQINFTVLYNVFLFFIPIRHRFQFCFCFAWIKFICFFFHLETMLFGDCTSLSTIFLSLHKYSFETCTFTHISNSLCVERPLLLKVGWRVSTSWEILFIELKLN